MSQLGFYYNSDICTGCKACQIACKDEHDLREGMLYRHVLAFEAGAFPNPRAYKLSIACNHCEHPKCVENCPTGAMYKRSEDGAVLHDSNRCMGCRMCVLSCPYDAPQFNEQTGMVEKCDACERLRAEGKPPACVAACMMRALDFGPIDELREKYGDIDEFEGMPSGSITNPSLIVNPHRCLG